MLTVILRLLFALCMAGTASEVFGLFVVYAGFWPPVWVLLFPAAPVAFGAYRIAVYRRWFE